MRLLPIAAVVILSSWAAAAARGAEQSFPVPGGGQVTLTVPDGWTADSDGATPPTIKAAGPAGQHASVQMTPTPPPPPAPAKPTDAQLKALSVGIARLHYAPSSVEKKVTAEPVSGPHVRGTACSFTDAAADPGEYRCVTSAVIAVDDVPFTVTVLSDAKTGAAHDAAMAIVRSASIKPAAGDKPPAAADAALRVASPDETWAVLVPGQWQVAGDDVHGGKQRQVMATDAAQTGWTLSVFVEPAPAKAGGTATAARESYIARMKQNPLGMKNLKRTEIGNVAIVEYDQVIGGTTDHNVNAYVSHAGMWVDVHLSKIDFDAAKDRAALDVVLKGIKLDPPDAAAPAKPAAAPIKPKATAHG